MNNFLHIITTRFNVPTKSWDKTKNGAPVLSDQWMDNRFDLFKNLTFSSMKNQSNQDFFWLVFFDKNTAPKYLKIIEDLNKEYAKFTPVFVDDFPDMEKTVLEKIQELKSSNHTYIISADIDNDDALHQDYIQTVQNLYEPKHNLVLDLYKGYKLIRKNRSEAIIQPYNSKANPFVSLVEKLDQARTVIKDKHTSYAQYQLYKSYQESPMYIQVIHEENLVNSHTRMKALSNIDLQDFGIESKYLKISEKETQKFNKNLQNMMWKEAIDYYFSKSFVTKKINQFFKPNRLH